MRRGLSVLVGGALLLAGCSRSHHPSIANPTPSPPVTATSVAVTTPAPKPNPNDWPTYHRDAARTGVAPQFPAPTGPLRLVAAVKLDGAVYASPIVAGGLTVVATEHDTVYALDADGHEQWHVHLGAPSQRADLPCGNIDPTGITGTPVYDPATRSVYAVAEFREPVRHELVALDLATGALRWRVDVDLPGPDPAAMQQRGALTVAAGRVWVPFGGRNGDCGNYTGRLVGVPLSGQGKPIAYTVPTQREGGIWTPPGAVVDPAGRLLVAVGNGASTDPAHYDHSDSVLAIDPKTAKLVDSFSPKTWPTDNAGDLDLGSQGPAVVAGKWVFTAGKSGMAYVLRLSHLGGVGGAVHKTQLCTSFGGAAVSGDVVYVPCTDGLRAVRIAADGSMHVLWHAPEQVAGSPVVGGGRVWAIARDDNALYSLSASTGKVLGQVTIGPVSRFATPALSAGRIYVPTLTGYAIVTAQ